MSDILNKATVLVLNRNWQAINVRTPQEAFCMMATNVATGLEIEGEDHIRPVTWEEWITLPIRQQDSAVHTVRGCDPRADGDRGGELRAGAEEASEVLHPHHPGTGRQPLPVHGSVAQAGGRLDRPHCAAVARRAEFVGELRVGES